MTTTTVLTHVGLFALLRWAIRLYAWSSGSGKGAAGVVEVGAGALLFCIQGHFLPIDRHHVALLMSAHLHDVMEMARLSPQQTRVVQLMIMGR